MTLTRLTPLDGDTILPLADAKLHLRVTHSSEDALIGSLRDAALSYIERASGIALAESDWRWSSRSFPRRVELPIGPVTALISVKYRDNTDTEQTFAAARLLDDTVYPAINGVWPLTYDHVAIEFTSGLSPPDAAPELIHAAKLLLSHFYENRAAVTVERGVVPAEVLFGVQALIDTHRKVLV